VTQAALQGLMDYPGKDLRGALEDLLFCEFHDILPGSSISQVETYALQRMDHGLEILSRLKTRAFFAFLSGQQKAAEGEFPVFVYNPHPHSVKETIICEFQPYEPLKDRSIVRVPEVTDGDGRIIPSQMEKESSNIAEDWRKRVVFQAELRPGQMNRFSCRLNDVKLKSKKKERKKTSLGFQSGNREIVINRRTGLVDRYHIDGIDFLKSQSFRSVACKDYPDPWAMLVRSFRNVKGRFTLMTKAESARFAGISAPELEPVRIIEDGPVRTVIEALFKYNNSAICQRYKILKKGSELEIEVQVFWCEKDCLLKFSIPTRFQEGSCKGQVMYGVEDFKRAGEELVAQKWVAAVASDKKYALTVINNGTYGFDFAGGELRLSLLRPAGYAAHPVGKGIPLVPQDRFEPRIDQGMRTFRFWINGGRTTDRLKKIDREALTKSEDPMVLSCFSSGKGEKIKPAVLLNDSAVQVTTLKMAEKKNWLLIRLFNPTGKKRKTNINIPFLNTLFDVSLRGFEIKTMAVALRTKDVFEVDLMERRIIP